MSGCPVCHAPVLNPRTPSHINSRRHQAAAAQLWAQGGGRGRSYRGQDYEEELDLAMPGDESSDYTSGSESELESPPPARGRRRPAPTGSWPGAGRRSRQPHPEQFEADSGSEEGSGSGESDDGEEPPYA